MVMPRIVVAAPASGQGKTTVSIGLMAALRQAGHKVAPFKVGPTTLTLDTTPLLRAGKAETWTLTCVLKSLSARSSSTALKNRSLPT